MKKLPFVFAFAFLSVCAGAVDSAFAQETRKDDASSIHWKLYPPLIGMPCPSQLVVVTSSKELVMGTFPLSKSHSPVTDGDTIRVEGLKESLRFVGLDAEETFKDPGKRRLAETNWAEYVRVECAGTTNPEHPPKYATFMGEAAKDAMRQLLEGVSEVRIEWDDPERKIDTFGRNLVFVMIQKNGSWMNLNVEMVRQGLSPYFIKYGKTRRMSDLFEAAQKEARAHERGIWSDPGLFRHYPDYPARLKWWNERYDDLTAAEALRAERKDVFILGCDPDWERLKKMEGKRATVAGVPNTSVQKGEHSMVPFGHRRGMDFMVVGSEAEITKLALKKEEGNLLYVTGVVELFRGLPQFRADTVKWSRRFKSGAESAPASR